MRNYLNYRQALQYEICNSTHTVICSIQYPIHRININVFECDTIESKKNIAGLELDGEMVMLMMIIGNSVCCAAERINSLSGGPSFSVH